MSESHLVTVLNLSRQQDSTEREKIQFLRNDLFFQYSFLLELDLSNNNLKFLPLSISQCFLLERINISYNPIVVPPLVLFSLPKIRQHPENLRFGENQKCTPFMVKSILNQSSQTNQIVIDFTEPDNSITTISVAPSTTLNELFVLTHPELSHLKDYLFIVRTVEEKYKLYLQPDTIPIAPYFYPDAKWSLELKYVPKSIIPQVLPLIKNYILQQKEIFNVDLVLTQALNFIPPNTASSSDIKNLVNIMRKSDLFSARHFIAYLENDKKLDVAATNDCITVRSYNSSNYKCFKQNSISFDCINTIFLLVCGDMAVKLNKELASGLLPLFAMAIEKSNLIIKNTDEISDLVASSDEAIDSISHDTKPLNVSEDQIDNLLQKLKEYKSSKVMFTANEKV